MSSSTAFSLIVFAGIPLFLLWQVARSRRALHVFQLEGYKRRRFLAYRAPKLSRALYLVAPEQKKPLVMTGRATRILVTALVLQTALLYAGVSIVHAVAGNPADLAAWAALTVAVFFATDALLVAADVALAPVQSRINGRFIAAASRKLAEIGPLVIGITGSYGKTSTKFAVARLAGSALEVLATPESFNTPLGVCRTINEQMGPAHRYFVVEMGAYREGDIAELCSFVHPAIGVLTAIGPMHLDRFGSMDAIRRGKYEIVTSLPEGGTAVMNVDDPEVRALADRTTGVKVVRYGADPNGRPHVTAEDVRVTPEGMELAIVDRRSGEGVTVATRLLGRHAVGHILAGAAVALVVGRPLAELKEPVAALEPVAHRLQLIAGQGGITVIDDAFNSNPEGAAAALEVLERMPGRKKVVVTPGIVELGELQHRANRTFGGHASRVADLLILVAGVNRDPLLEGAAEGDAEVVTVDSLAEATRALEGRIARGDVVLFENDLPDQYEG